MNKEEFAKFFAIVDKLKIEQNPNLSAVEKECWKQVIDYIKEKALEGK